MTTEPIRNHSSSRPQRRHPRRHSQRPARPPLQVPDPGPGRRGHHRRPHPARDGTAARPEGRPPPGHAHARLHRAEPAGRAPHRRSQSPALAECRPRLRRGSPSVPSHVAVWRSVRAHGETKTERSRRTLALPAAAVQALRALRDTQAEERLTAGEAWQDSGLVFTTHHGAALDAANVRKMFKGPARSATCSTASRPNQAGSSALPASRGRPPRWHARRRHDLLCLDGWLSPLLDCEPAGPAPRCWRGRFVRRTVAVAAPAV
jgi:hypothetical protein